MVYYPINYCKNGVTIIDTPGLNDDAAMTEVTMSVLPTIDAALMVIMAQAPFSESERDFLESKIITSDLGRVLFVVTGIDLLDEEDVDRVLENIKRRIQEHVLKKAESVYGVDSREYQTYQRKLGNITLYGLSAKKALKAKVKGDVQMLEDSCFPTFEAALEKFLSEERGAITLSVPVSRIKTASMELVKAIQLRMSSMDMMASEFEKKYTAALGEIESVRKERSREFDTVNENASDDREPLKGVSILLAEDNEINMEIVLELLSAQGARVQSAWNGKEALESFEAAPEGSFDIILMDMQMPVMDGCETAINIRSMQRKDMQNIPIIALTANAFSEDMQATSKAGMNAHITKPIN